jgi:hypothetical protein
MDKKILLSGAAALLLGASLFAAPASASISISHSGEAKLSAQMNDACSVSTADIDSATATTGNSSATNNGTCTGSEENPLWSTSSKLDWSAGGTLANGLSVSTSQDGDINLSGAFGSVAFKNGGDSAAKTAMVNSDGAIDVTGEDIGGHKLATSGTAGTVVTYAAPSMGGMDLYISYAPNSARDDTSSSPITTDASPYTDTIGFGAAFSMDTMSVSIGWESATANDTHQTCTTANAATQAAAGSLVAQADEIAGGLDCGDQTLLMFGAKMSVGDLSINGGYSQLDTEEADTTVMNIGVGMSVGDYNLTLDYVDANKDRTKLAGMEDDQTVIQVGASTSLGDGVDLGLKFSNNSYETAGLGAQTNYRANAELKITY